MAQIKKSGPSDAALSGMARPTKAEDGQEFGVATSFPVTSYDNFAAIAPDHMEGQSVYLLGKAEGAVPVEKLIEMRRRDAQTRSLLRLLILPILACTADGQWVAPEDVKDSEKEVEFANQMFSLPPYSGGMSVPLNLVVKQHLLALVEGFSVFEEVRYVPKVGPLKGKWCLRKLAHRNASTIRFLVDDHGGFAGVVQRARKPDNTILETPIAQPDVLFYTMHPEENPYYGVSMFESSWYNYDIKSKLYYVAQVAAQINAVSGRVGSYPHHATPTQRNAFSKALSDFAFNNSLMLPPGFDLKPFQSSGTFPFLDFIKYHNSQQAKSVLLQFADSDQRLAVIENGGADASADFFIQALESIMDDIAQTWSVHLMPKYIDWNFGSGKYPVWKFGSLSDSARDVVKEIFTSIVTSGILNCTPEFMRETEERLAARLGYDIDYEAIREREAEAAEAAAAQQEAEALAAERLPEEEEAGVPGEDSAPEAVDEDVALSGRAAVDDLVRMASELQQSGYFQVGRDAEYENLDDDGQA